MTKYPNFFTIHTISFSNKEDQLKARRSMEAYFQKIRTILITTLEADASIDSSVFSEEFSRQDLVDFVLSNMMTIFLLRQGNT
ncbi:hypothetical protein, partial [Streptomyces acidiscabies]|uniref:hypothetical protein n=1 Tax=Streptomyces acidiscabies TaxID=42234 RepID=UPI0038F669AA